MNFATTPQSGIANLCFLYRLLSAFLLTILSCFQRLLWLQWHFCHLSRLAISTLSLQQWWFQSLRPSTSNKPQYQFSEEMWALSIRKGNSGYFLISDFYSCRTNFIPVLWSWSCDRQSCTVWPTKYLSIKFTQTERAKEQLSKTDVYCEQLLPFNCLLNKQTTARYFWNSFVVITGTTFWLVPKSGWRPSNFRLDEALCLLI